MNINHLVIDYLAEQGFKTSEWLKAQRIDYSFTYNDGYNNCMKYSYPVVPGLHQLIITVNKSGGVIKLKGIPGFEMEIDIRDPESLPILVEKLKKLYIWMKNINSDHARRLTHESTRFNSGAIIGNS